MGIINRLKARASRKKSYADLMRMSAEEKALKRKEEDAARRVTLGKKAIQQHSQRLVLEKRGTRSVKFMQDCIRVRKKLTPSQQVTLQKNLWEINEKLSDFVLGEGSIMMERDLFPASKIRLQKAFDLKEKLIEDAKVMEGLGLVKSGFTSNTFFIKKPIKP